MTDAQFERIKKGLNFHSEGGVYNLCTLTETTLRALLDKASKTIEVEHFEAYGQCRDSRRIADLEAKLKHAEENCINKTCVVFKDKEDCVAKLLDLEKENAELKEKNKWYSEQVCNKKCAEVWGNLTEAKEIIKDLLSFVDSLGNYSGGIFAKAEQFLNCSEKPNN